MPSLIPEVLDRLVLTHDVVSTIRSIGEGKGKQDLFQERAPDVLENLRQVAIIESTESSNRLEGVTVPRTTLERLVKGGAPKGGDRSEGEIAGYRSVLGLLHERQEYIELAPNVIRQLHRDLFRFSSQNGGEWKAVDNTITERRPDGTVFVRFRPTPAWQTDEAMRDLQENYVASVDTDVDPLILIALYILDSFVFIHSQMATAGWLGCLASFFFIGKTTMSFDIFPSSA
jgi:hypothetical protein